jgi:hypothetical protein
MKTVPAAGLNPAELLRLAARGRAAYAESAPPEQAAILKTEANTFESAAELLEDPTAIWRLIPSWMPVEPPSG